MGELFFRKVCIQKFRFRFDKNSCKTYFFKKKANYARMGMGNLLILAQVTTYLLLFIVSFFVFVPLVINNAEFNGNCLLFARGEWSLHGRGPEGQYQLKVTHWGSSSSCDFPILVGVVAIPLTFFYVLWMSAFLYRQSEP